MALDIDNFRKAALAGRIEWRKHTLQRMMERHILQRDVLEAIRQGELIREYPTDRPFPSMLLLGWINSRPLHVVGSHDSVGDTAYIITVYEPSPDVFEADFKTRKP